MVGISCWLLVVVGLGALLVATLVYLRSRSPWLALAAGAATLVVAVVAMAVNLRRHR